MRYANLCRFPDRFIIGLSKAQRSSLQLARQRVSRSEENGSKLGFRFERPQGTFAEEVRITEAGRF